MATFRSLVDVLLRKAAYEVTNSNTNAQTYLQTLVVGQFDTIQAQGGAQIVAVAVNGKSTQLQIPAGGWTQTDIASGAEYALQLLEGGWTRTTAVVTSQHVDS